MNKDIKALLSIYTILILTGWLMFNNIAHKKELAKLNKDRIETMEIAVNLNNALDEYVLMLDSMNKYADELENEIQDYKHLETLKKDLARHTKAR